MSEELEFTEADRVAIKRALAQRSFPRYRRMLRPKMKRGWWQESAAGHLQAFAEQMARGERPKLVIEAPPQHGKSELIIDFVSWLAGKEPDYRTIYASFSERLGVRANLRLQRIYDGPFFAGVFPDTRINQSNVVTVSGQYLRNREILEYVGREGYFRNTTVRGSITGEGLDLGVIDDPIKGREEASSKAVREKTWAWLTDDFLSRFSDHAGLLAILTRWHVDDPIGRLIQRTPGVKVVKYPAIADASAILPPDDPREPGSNEPLFPEHKSYDFLMERHASMSEASWQSLYQQNPVIIGGGTFPVDRFGFVDVAPEPRKVVATARYWDKAGTRDGGDFTVGCRMSLLVDGRIVVEHVRRGQWAAAEREEQIEAAANQDGYGVVVYVEQEPGSGGKESAEATIRRLAGHRVYADRVTGDKEARADPYAAQVQAGNVYLVRGEWNRAFVDEHEVFPNGPHDDQVDAAGGAFAMLVGTNSEAGVW